MDKGLIRGFSFPFASHREGTKLTGHNAGFRTAEAPEARTKFKVFKETHVRARTPERDLRSIKEKMRWASDGFRA